MKTFGEALRLAMAKNSIKQIDIAAFMNKQPATIWRWKNEESLPSSPEDMAKVLKFVGVKLVFV